MALISKLVAMLVVTKFINCSRQNLVDAGIKMGSKSLKWHNHNINADGIRADDFLVKLYIFKHLIPPVMFDRSCRLRRHERTRDERKISGKVRI
jgi:hypothetical protein